MEKGIFTTGSVGEYFNPKATKRQEHGENYIMRCFIIHNLSQTFWGGGEG
jgi:hypothetical protein